MPEGQASSYLQTLQHPLRLLRLCHQIWQLPAKRNTCIAAVQASDQRMSGHGGNRLARYCIRPSCGLAGTAYANTACMCAGCSHSIGSCRQVCSDHEATAINPFCSGGRCCRGMVVQDGLQSLTFERTQPQNHHFVCAVANDIRPQASGATAARRGPSAMAYSVCS